MKDRKLIIHAGMRKTGTTAIQEYLFEKLNHTGVGYFSMGMANSSLLMTQAFQRDFDRLPQFRGEGWSPEQVDSMRAGARNQFVRVARRCKRPTTILSAEVISSFTAQELEDLKEVAGRFFSHIQVLIYVRPPQSRAESVFQERLKSGYTDLTRPVPANFVGLGRKFDSVFSAENVIFRPFLPQDFPSGSVVADFLDLIGVPLSEMPERRANRALSLPAVQLLYIYRKFFPEFKKRDKHLVALLFDLPGEGFRMHSSLVDTVVREKPVSREWLATRVGINLEVERGSDEGGVRDEADLTTISDVTVSWVNDHVRKRGGALSAEPGLLGIAENLRTIANYQKQRQLSNTVPRWRRWLRPGREESGG